MGTNTNSSAKVTATQNESTGGGKSLQPIDVIDSTVKIGLGALVAGLASYFVARMDRRKTLEKETLAKQLEMLMQVATKVDEFHSAMMDYVCGCPVSGEGDKCPVGDPLVAARLRIQADIASGHIERQNARRQKAREGVTFLITARSYLSLLGYAEALAALKVYKDSAEKFWLEVGDEKKPMDATLFVNLKSQISKCHYELYDELSRVFPVGRSGIRTS